MRECRYRQRCVCPLARRLAFWALLWCVLSIGGFASAADMTGLSILPPRPVLRGVHARQQLVVEETRGTQAVGDLTAQAKFVSSNPQVAAVDDHGIVTPRANGTATIRVTVGGRWVETVITVERLRPDESWSFRNDAQMVLTRAGCNMGACHGAQAGKKSFKLSLRGYDHEADYDTLTRQARGRRVSTSDPAQSLVLLKATGVIPHGGGARFDTHSLEYRILSEWIADGAPGPQTSDPTVVGVEIFPKQSTLGRQGAQQLLVEATYSDGTRRDVTHWAKYTSTEAGVATVDADGKVRVAGYGESAITVWFASRVSIASVSVPFDTPVPAEVFARSARHNFIDDLVLDKLQQLRIPPSGPANDSEFLRRAYLDTAGILPSLDETKKFLADKPSDKRATLIDQLLKRPEYVDYWTYKWSDLLLVSTKTRKLTEPAVWSFYRWIRQSVAENKPWDQFAREVVTAKGSTLENGAANYFVLHKDPKVLNETTTLTFMGLSIGCAQCHDHPLERWTQDDYYGMANLFARVRLKDGAGGEVVVYPTGLGEILHPARGTAPIPRPLDGVSLSLEDPRDRREHLARWLTSSANPYFARAIVNRVWANYMGRGLVEMVDDLRATNPPTNERLLQALADDLVRHRYDLKHLIRTIMSSAAYQRTASPVAGNAADDRFYSHFLNKRLAAEVMLDALSQVTGVPTEFPDYPKGGRALQLPDTNIASYFLSAFGRPAREFTCECERSEEPSVTQTLHLANGQTLNDKLKARGGTLDRWLDTKLPDGEIVEQLYLAAFSRHPTAVEKERLVRALSESPSGAPVASRRAILEDLIWAALTSKEFLFVH